MQRKDKQISVTSNFDGNSRVGSSTAFPADVVAGQSIYINSGPYVGVFTVLSVHNTPSYYIVIDAPYTSHTVSGFVNFLDAYENYYVETIVYGITIANAYYEVGTMVNKPGSDGISAVDTAAFLKTIVSFQDTFTYDQLNKRDETMSGRFNIQYREVYNGVAQAWSGVSSTLVYYFTNATKQVQQRYGSNVGEHVPFVNADTTEQKAKFLSDFAKPTYFPGFPFSLAFIYADTLAGLAVSKFERKKDLNGVAIATTEFELSTGQSLYVNRLMLEQGYDSSVKEVDVWLEAGGASCQQYFEEGYIADGYFEQQCGLPDIAIPETPDEA